MSTIHCENFTDGQLDRNTSQKLKVVAWTKTVQGDE